MLSERGAALVDADAVAHQLTGSGGAAIDALRDTFGAEAIGIDGSLDRAYMRAQVFSDSALRTKLEAVLHPMIRAAMRDLTDKLISDGAAYVVQVVPLLVEGGRWSDYVDRVLLIDCSEATQLARMRARVGIDESTARQIIAAQAARIERLAVANDVLVNESGVEQIAPRVDRLHQTYLRSAAIKRSLETL